MPPRKPSPVGAHVFVGGGLLRSALPYAEQVGARAVQVFVSNPRGWAQAAGDPATDEAFAAACAERRTPVFVHAPYLANLGSPNETTGERSVDAVRHAVARGRRLGAAGVVVHAGSAVEAGGRGAGLARVRERVRPLLDGLGPGLRLLVEPTAGGGEPLAAHVDDLAAWLAAADGDERVGVCLDTCHLWAAGHDLAAPGGVRRTLDRLVRSVGRGRLGLVHANDSLDPLGSGRDRHANIGAGRIGTAPFAELFRHPATRGVPVLVETPGGAEAHAADIATLVALRDG